MAFKGRRELDPAKASGRRSVKVDDPKAAKVMKERALLTAFVGVALGLGLTYGSFLV